MAGRRKHVEVVGGAQDAALAVDVVKEAVVDSLHQVVGIVVVVAEEGRFVPEREAHLLMALPIGLHRLDHLLQRIDALVVDVLLDRGEAVGDGADAAALDVVAVVARAAVVVILALLDAVADDAREVGGRHVGRVLVAEVVVDADLGLYRMGHLFRRS